MSAEYAGHGTRVTLHFALRLDSGEEVDSTFGGEPGVFEFGDGTLPQGFESCIQGMQVGERQIFEVPPEKAFGQPNPNNLQTFSLKDFSNAEDLEPGMVFSFADASQSELPGVVHSVTEEEVTVDFNHPLSGRHLLFEVEILGLEACSREDAV